MPRVFDMTERVCHHPTAMWHIAEMRCGTSPAQDGRPLSVSLECSLCGLWLVFTDGEEVPADG
jgi:hypothetical protein